MSFKETIVNYPINIYQMSSPLMRRHTRVFGPLLKHKVLVQWMTFLPLSDFSQTLSTDLNEIDGGPRKGRLYFGLAPDSRGILTLIIQR